MQDGLVSVIIPAYRADDYIAATLERVLRQTYANWEVILVEDASEGQTERVMREFASQAHDRRALYVRHEVNQGQAAARNTALGHARGEFIALLDSDDLWLEGHLEAAVSGLVQWKGDIAFSTAVTFDDQTGVIEGTWGPSSDELRRFPDSLFYRSFITPSATVMRAAVFDRVGPFDASPGLRGTEDLDFWLRSVREEIRFTYVPYAGCLYRKNHHGAATSNMPTLQPRVASTYEKHADLWQVSSSVRRRCIAHHFAYAGHFNAVTEWRCAPGHYFKAWSWNARRLDCLLLGLCGPFLPLLVRVRPKYRRLLASHNSDQCSMVSDSPSSPRLLPATASLAE